MNVSAFDLFKIGVGPSSSHTVGPMLAACLFAESLHADQSLSQVFDLTVELFGSLGATGHGHGSVPAVVLGLMRHRPDRVEPNQTPATLEHIRESGKLSLLGRHDVWFDIEEDIVLHRRKKMQFHSNAMLFKAWARDNAVLSERTYYSVGGGFVLDEEEASRSGSLALTRDPAPVPPCLRHGDQVLNIAQSTDLRISDVVWENEIVRRPGPGLLGQGRQDDARDRRRHEGQVQGTARRPRAQCRGMLRRNPCPSRSS